MADDTSEKPGKIETGGPAFPRPTSDVPGQPGMTLRDWFAGQALAGVLAFPAGEDEQQLNAGAAAREAYRYADSMIAQRSKPSAFTPKG